MEMVLIQKVEIELVVQYYWLMLVLLMLFVAANCLATDILFCFFPP
jgi:hypothetical protein